MFSPLPGRLIVINDGHLVEESISRLGYSLSGFKDYFSRNCPRPVGEIYIATLDAGGTLYYSEM